MYAILIKEPKNNTYRFLTVKQEIMEEVTEEVTEPGTGEVHEVTSSVGTGEYETVVYETESQEELEKKCIDLMQTYTTSDFIAVNKEVFDVDLIWKQHTHS